MAGAAVERWDPVRPHAEASPHRIPADLRERDGWGRQDRVSRLHRQWRARGAAYAGDIDEVLDRDRHTAQRSGRYIRTPRLAGAIRGATLTGQGPTVMTQIDMVATDLGFSIGTCGKDGQGVPVGVGQPTMLIERLTVGGTAA